MFSRSRIQEITLRRIIGINQEGGETDSTGIAKLVVACRASVRS